MNLKTLPTRYFRPVGFRKDGRPIFPIAGGSEPPNQGGAGGDSSGGGAGGDQGAGGGGGDQQQSTEPVEARDEHGAGLGFPKDTPVEKMTDAQKANYWRNQTKVANKRVPSNLDQIQRDAAAWAEYQRTQKPPEQQAIDNVKTETEKRVRREVAEDSALALLRVTLTQRGKTAAEVDEIVDPLNPAKFLTQDDKLDTDRVTSFVEKLAPSQSGGGGNGIGQGRFDRPPTSRAAAGKAESERRGYTKAPGTSSLLPQNR